MKKHVGVAFLLLVLALPSVRSYADDRDGNYCISRIACGKPENTMNDDAFDDLRGEFDYKEELNRARAALNAKIGRFASDRPGMGYRELAKKFKISPGAVCAIARGYRLKRKRGPRAGTS